MRTNHKLQRLFIRQPLSPDTKIIIEGPQAAYLIHVLRMRKGSEILLFNGHEGEWFAQLIAIEKRTVVLKPIHQERHQTVSSDLICCFAPLKHARLDYMVQKAVEMGVSVLQPVITQHTQVTRINKARIEANIIEASEQCGILFIPKCEAAVSLEDLLAHWKETHALFFCDEALSPHDLFPLLKQHITTPLGVLIGPEGGFSEDERAFLKQYPFVIPISLGSRVLRSDTAAVAALAVINAARNLFN